MITRESGLSNSSVSCIHKDKYGFIWIGTWNGLNRYDGYDMTVYRCDPLDSTTLSNSNINVIFEDREGDLWIATDNGLNRYDQFTGKYKRYYVDPDGKTHQRNNQINGITQDSKGLIWAGTLDQGLISVNKSTGEINQYLNEFSDRSNMVMAVLADNLNPEYLWTGTADGLFRFNKVTETFEPKTKGVINGSFSVQVMSQDKYGNLYLGTWGNGLIKYDRQKASLVYTVMKKEHEELIRASIIRTMSFDGKGNLLFNVRDIGLMSYHLSTGTINNFSSGVVNEDLNNKAVSSMCYEPSGILWVGTLYDGVIKIVPLINSFKHYSSKINITRNWNGGGITSILEDQEGDLWLGTRYGGLMKLNRETQESVVFMQTEHGLSSNNILSLIESGQGKDRHIWIGTDGGGLNCLNPVTGKFIAYRNDSNLSHGPSSNSISALIQYDKDHLLIGTRDRNLGEGMDVFNMKTGKFINLRYKPNDSSSLGSNNIQKLFMDRTGIVWVGTRNGGLNKFIVKNISADNPAGIGCFIRYTSNPKDPKSLNNNTIYSIHDDSRNNLWIGTNEGGLSRFDPQTGTFTSEDVQQTLKDHLVYGILADDNDNLWLSTSMGIIAVNLKSNDIHSFDKYDGLQESAFIYGSYYKSVSGELFFGGIKGCNSFHPDSIKLNMKFPPIVITSMNLSGKKGNIAVTEITGKSILASKKVETPYYQNSFSITFSALDYQRPEKNRFKYKLDGYDKDWIETTSRRRYVNYTNLPSGKYIFRVIGSNSDEIWNHEGTSVTIHILPPFWRTTTFYLLLAGLFLGLMAILTILIIRKYKRHKVQVEMEVISSIQDERKQLRTLIDNIPDLVFIKDRQSRFTLANTKVATVMKTTTENLIGYTDFEFYPTDLAVGFFKDEQKIMETGIPMINIEENALDENDNRTIRSTTKVPIRNSNGEIIGIAGICRDITKLKNIETQLIKKSDDLLETNRLLEKRQKEILVQSEELAEQTQNLLMMNAELDRLNRTKDKFFSIIAHDLRNPFNAIIGFCELLRNDFYDMDNKQKLNVLELINVSSQTAYNLLENLLQWARTQTDKINFNPENFNLSEIANAVIDLHCVIARKKGVKMRNAIEENTQVYADKNMISAVLRNLVSNAIKFSNPDGEIVISVKHKPDLVEVNVIDGGIGMDRECLGKLFKIDTYYSTSGTMGESGTGLGLIICKEFVEKNNGRIKASSVEGAGTTMTFTLNSAKLN